MNGEIITSAEMAAAGQHVNTLNRVAIQHGLDGELAEVINFLNALHWKGAQR